VTLRDKVRSCESRRALNVELGIWIERSQLFWFGHVSRITTKFGEPQPVGTWLFGMAISVWAVSV